MTEIEVKDEKFMKDLTKTITAVSQLHGGITYLLEGKCTAHIEFDDGNTMDLDLSDAISFAVGLELGITLDELMRCQTRADIKNVSEKPLLVLKQVLNEYLSKKLKQQ